MIYTAFYTYERDHSEGKVIVFYSSEIPDGMTAEQYAISRAPRGQYLDNLEEDGDE